jgi:hypothetical protein
VLVHDVLQGACRDQTTRGDTAGTAQSSVVLRWVLFLLLSEEAKL